LNPNRLYVLVLKHALLGTATGGWKRRHAVWYIVTENNFKTTMKIPESANHKYFWRYKTFLKLRTKSMQADGPPKAA